MLAQNPETAIGPTVALLLRGLDGVGYQAVSVAPVCIMNLPPMLEYQQAEVAVFDNRIARPAAGRDQRSAADQAHRAMHDDRVCLVSLDHTDIEEAGIFAIHRVMHDGTIAVAM